MPTLKPSSRTSEASERINPCSPDLETRVLRVSGTVQGVGFRPFVYRLALGMGVSGWVCNDAQGVTIEASASRKTLEQFQAALKLEKPPAAQVETVTILESQLGAKHTGFAILESQDASSVTTLISPDLPVCEDCLLEMRDPTNRRYQYPFINCTNCGPRYSIILSLPYDRPKTTMRVFPMCPDCELEYHDPLDRRFHAQPIACSVCGPGLQYLSSDGQVLARGNEVIALAVHDLSAGKILAIKGLGGYHLACDARNARAVATLRERKFRKEKPFALMARDLKTLEGQVELSTEARALLTGGERPIVLLPKTPSSYLPDALAPENADLGVMLPYTPLQHLLFDAGAPELLVMTSANHSSEPIAYTDQEALEHLSGLAHGFVIGEREIARRVDDSVTSLVAGETVILRRARGYAPAPVIASERFKRPILALGADLKSSITLAVHGQAFVSQHLGDLENLAAFQAFQETIYDLCQMYRVKLEDALVVHDLHPNYASTRFALEAGSQRLGVQHHEAHIASVLAEHKAWDAPVLGFAFDGTGFGHDSTIWGGEVFHGSLEHGFERVAHLRTAPVPGGDAAARHPTQAAVGFLANCKDAVLEKILEKPFNFPSQRVQVARALISSGLNTTATSSMGRLFDTVSALTGFTRKMSFEGQAAIRLEALARGLPAEYPYPFPFDGNTWDYAPLLKALLEDVAAGIKVSIIARRFHETIAQGVLEATQTLARSRSFAVVALSGGVFQNRLLLELCLERLHRHGFEVWFNRFVPANDGGISLGQAALAAHQEV